MSNSKYRVARRRRLGFSILESGAEENTNVSNWGRSSDLRFTYSDLFDTWLTCPEKPA